MPDIVFIRKNGTRQGVSVETGISLMRAAVDNNVEGIIGECGGSLTCATCHVYVDEAWLSRIGPPSEEEEFLLEYVAVPQANSRLSCQISLREDLDGLVVQVPEEQTGE